MGDGTAAELTRLKRIDAQQRQKIAVACLAGHEIQTNPKSYHLWLTLPPHWRSQTFVAAAARRDIALTPSTTFAASPGHAPNAVRLALAAPPIEQLEAALRTLSGMLNAKEEDFDFDRIARVHATGHAAIKPFALYGSILSHSRSTRIRNSGSVCQSARGVAKLSTVTSIFSTSGQCRCSVIG